MRDSYNQGKSFTQDIILILISGIFLLSFVSAELPTIERVANGSVFQLANITLSPNISAGQDDIILAHFGGTSTAAWEVDFSTWGSENLLFSMENGTTRNLEMWYHVVQDPENQPLFVATENNITRRVAHGFVVSGADTADFLGGKYGSGQNVANNAQISITTTRNDSIVVGVVAKSNTEAININSTLPIAILGTETSGTQIQIISFYFNASEIGTYQVNANWSSSIASVMLLYEVRSTGESPPIPTNFNATNVTSNNLAPFATALMNSDSPNILIMGDSLAVPHGWLPARWSAAFLKTFNHTNGYHSITTGAGLGTNPAFIEMQELATFTGDSSLNAYITTNDYWKDGSYFGGLWTGRDLIFNVALTGYTPGTAGNAVRYFLKDTGFDDAVIPDWFTGKNLALQWGYLYDGSINYATSFVLKNGTGDGTFYKLYNTTNSTQVVDGLYNKSINLLSDKITVNSSGKDFFVSNLTGVGDYFFAGSTIKISDDSNPTGVDFATLGQSSTSYADTYSNQDATATEKYYKKADLSRYLSNVFPRNNSDNFVFIMFAPEGGTLEAQSIRINDMLNNISEDYVNAGLEAPMFALVSSWRGDTEDDAISQAEIFYNISNTRSDSALISIYGLTEGIYLNGTNPLQTQYAIDNGYDAIERNTDTLNISALQLIDTNNGVHQNSNNAAFFFSYLLVNEIYGSVENGTDPLLLTINSPENITYAPGEIMINVSTSVAALVQYSLDGGATNITLNPKAGFLEHTATVEFESGNYVMTFNAASFSSLVNNTESVSFFVESEVAPTDSQEICTGFYEAGTDLFMFFGVIIIVLVGGFIFFMMGEANGAETDMNGMVVAMIAAGVIITFGMIMISTIGNC